MPKPKVNHRNLGGKPLPDFACDPEQYIYQELDPFVQVSQRGLHNHPTILTRYIETTRDADNIIQWMNKCSLSGNYSTWRKIINHSFIAILEMNLDRQKELYQKYRESQQVELERAIRRLEKVKEVILKTITTIDENMVGCISGVYEDIKKNSKIYLDYIDGKLSEYQKMKNQIYSENSSKYAFVKPFIDNLKIALNDVGISKNATQINIVYELFKVFEFGDFDYKVGNPNFIIKQKGRIRTNFFKN
ncbi:hypothetical protein HOE22_06015 [Candidatus Woesearchaeota archaeon]|jgi:hypothetical protein|nr:hypothetical protein [Candidatus Woesearchaeota archaeon]MBT5528500.1 hypothetical protein [Cytophagia bacterium]MBT5991923.1 hypothetical protein [Bacteroidota bacterium]